jgi:AraC-like DNA-binding protein
MRSTPISQADALALSPLSPGESARYFGAARFPALDCLSARFTTHAYPPHTHDTYVIGTIEAGCEIWHARGVRHHATAGDIVFNHPLDIHDGLPGEGGYAYRMTYPSVELITEIARDVTGRDAVGTPFFHAATMRDPETAAAFSAAHRAVEAAVDGLAGEEALTRAYALCLVRHANLAQRRLGREGGPVTRVRDAIEARHGEDLRLDDLARLAGLSRHHLIRAFAAETGITPHAYLIDVRVRRAREAIRAGRPIADVAHATGFADQAHLTRAFKARVGVSPGAYRRAVQAA